MEKVSVIIEAPMKQAALNCVTGKRKVRKRRAINRTGFPSAKKKKKKLIQVPKIEPPTETESVDDDRVPREGEEYTTFVQRTEKSLNQNQHIDQPIPDVTKWEVLSECDSLPQEDRIDYVDIKLQSLKCRDVSPSTSIETRSSKVKREVSTEKDDLDEVALDKRIKRIKLLKKRKLLNSTRNTEVVVRPKGHFRRELRKRRLRELSPASSVEPEKKSKDEFSTSGDDKKSKKAPRWRKRYLAAGLFSDYYKEDE